MPSHCPASPCRTTKVSFRTPGRTYQNPNRRHPHFSSSHIHHPSFRLGDPVHQGGKERRLPGLPLTRPIIGAYETAVDRQSESLT
jgi:hypothetical protein